MSRYLCTHLQLATVYNLSQFIGINNINIFIASQCKFTYSWNDVIIKVNFLYLNQLIEAIINILGQSSQTQV